MINLDQELNKIYHAKTREYFKEVLSSYDNGNYRSAIVMLYSVVICDLLFKLQEMRDLYDDGIAKDVLDNLPKPKLKSIQYNTDSKWERELVDAIREKTEMLDNQTYMNIKHLAETRNLSAHPALNSDFELYKPSKESVVSYINNIFTDILIKPSLFLSNVIEVLTEDLKSKKSYYYDDEVQLKNYLIKKYLSRMSTALLTRTFECFWKFCFIKEEDIHETNRKINSLALNVMFEYKKDELLFYIKENKEKFVVSGTSSTCRGHLVMFLSRNVKVYSILSEDTINIIDKTIPQNQHAVLISWFKEESKEKHFEKLIESGFFREAKTLNSKVIKDAFEACASVCSMSIFINAMIIYFGSSGSFNAADNRFESSIKPYLEQFNRDQFIKLISEINSNNQIHMRQKSLGDNTTIINYANKYLGDEFDFNEFSKFKFERTEIEESEVDEMEMVEGVF